MLFYKINMGDFKRERNFGRRDSNRPRGRDSDRFGRRDSNRLERGPRQSFDRQLHRVTCDKCGESCEVPFKPTEGKPVYCNDCFRKKDNSSSSGSNQFREEIEQINQKLDKILEILNTK